MTPVDELPLVFACAGEQMVGVLTKAGQGKRVGVLFLIGGDQYRVGSHRQFTLLARALARQGYAALRFDYRGVGDSTGVAGGFEQVGTDICAASERFLALCPELDRIVMVGLCDGASSALMFAEVLGDRLAGLCLLNPWVRSEQSLAKAQVKHYYREQFFNRAFWRKLVSGRVPVYQALREFQKQFWRSLKAGNAKDSVVNQSFQDKMAHGLQQFTGPVLLILSGNDLTAREFDEYTRASSQWRRLLCSDRIRRHDLPEADHTFSSAQWRGEVETCMLHWLAELEGRHE